ncbi:MAG: Bax inhibitor-1 family protein [Acidimicrobiales bacterium]
MSQPTFTTGIPVARQAANVRAEFLKKVYIHLLGAIGAFIAIEIALFMGGAAEGLYNFLTGGRGGWLLILGGFMVVNWIASQAAHNINNRQAQYLGLVALAAAEAVIFAPFLYYVFNTDGAGTVASAALITGVGFLALTAVGLLTSKDLSVLRPLIMWGSIVALLAIVGAVLFGATLGVWFSVAMVGLAGAAILYQTQSIMKHYPEWAYVGAAVSLFGSLMTMFFYILRIMSRR